MNISLVQFNIAIEEAGQNLALINGIINKQFEESDILLLPEMFNTGFTMNVKACAENMNGNTVSWMKQKACELNTAIVGSLIIAENEKFYNRLLVVKPNGETQHYDKRHLFGLGNEDQYYTAGQQQLVFEYKGWKICPLICYDLRFPVWSRNTSEYDILIYAANWPAAREHAWNTLLKARAIENQCYVVACNRTGTDGNDISYNGYSQFVDYKGMEIKNLESHENWLINVSLSKHDLQDFREKYPFLKDRDQFSFKY